MSTFMDKTKMAFGMAGLQVKKKLPEITLILGIATFVGTIVTASKATLKLEEMLADEKESLEKIHAFVKGNPDSEYVKNEDDKRDKLICYTKMTVNTLKLYAPTIVLGSISIGLILTSHSVLNKRYLSAVAAYNTVTEAFETYRERAVKKYGEKADRELRYGAVYDENSVTVIDENGKKKKEKEVIENIDFEQIANNNGAVMFDETNPNWDQNATFNRSYLLAQQEKFTSILNSRGYVFLNEVYRDLQFPLTSEGALIGWIWKEGGNNFVDFGIYKDTEGAKSFINGKSNVVLLDFNTQGIIFDKI